MNENNFKEEIQMEKESRFPWWWKLSLILGVICLAAFIFVRFGYWEKLTRPKVVKIVQTFKEGESLKYEVSQKMTTDMDEFTSIIQQAGILSLEVPKVHPDGLMEIVITKESGVTTMMDRTRPDSDVGKQVKVKLLPTGIIKSVEGNILGINHYDFIPQFLPQKEIKVGDSWEPPLGKFPGSDATAKYTVVGFEKIKGFDCLKVQSIKSRTTDLRKLDFEMIKRAESKLELKADDITGPISTVTKEEIFFDYRRNYRVIKLHKTYTMQSEVEGEKIITTMETTVELL